MAHAHNHSASEQNRNRLIIVLVLTSIYLVAEVIGGIMVNSLALLADAGHMLTDAGGLALALFAIQIGKRPADSERTYGYYRAEILASVINAVVLIGIALFILFEAYRRFLNPPAVQTTPMMIVATVGLVVNLAGMFLLKSGAEHSLNMKGAYFEVMSDLLTSIAVIAAALLIKFTGWQQIDPILSAGIGLFILPRTWNLLKEGVGILLEGTPKEINLAKVRKTIQEVSAVHEVHDLHVWSLTSGIHALSAHIIIKKEKNYLKVLTEIRKRIVKEYKIEHITLQPEPLGFDENQIHI